MSESVYRRGARVVIPAFALAMLIVGVRLLWVKKQQERQLDDMTSGITSATFPEVASYAVEYCLDGGADTTTCRELLK